MSKPNEYPRFTSVLALALLVVAVSTMATTTSAASTSAKAKVTAMFVSPTSYRTSPAVTYDRSSVRLGSRVQVLEEHNNTGGLVVQLGVWGLTPNRNYNAYVYTRPCGLTPASAGKRTQNGPSNEHYPQNEVWLNFKTNVRGAAHSQVSQNWTFNADQANSVVLLMSNAARVVACVTVPFK
jgi:Cu-Zn family superoxide dismutase